MARADERLVYERAVDSLRRRDGAGVDALVLALEATLALEQKAMLAAPLEALAGQQGRLRLAHELLDRTRNASAILLDAERRASKTDRNPL